MKWNFLGKKKGLLAAAALGLSLVTAPAVPAFAAEAPAAYTQKDLNAELTMAVAWFQSSRYSAEFCIQPTAIMSSSFKSSCENEAASAGACASGAPMNETQSAAATSSCFFLPIQNSFMCLPPDFLKNHNLLYALILYRFFRVEKRDTRPVPFVFRQRFFCTKEGGLAGIWRAETNPISRRLFSLGKSGNLFIEGKEFLWHC